MSTQEKEPLYESTTYTEHVNHIQLTFQTVLASLRSLFAIALCLPCIDNSAYSLVIFNIFIPVNWSLSITAKMTAFNKVRFNIYELFSANFAFISDFYFAPFSFSFSDFVPGAALCNLTLQLNMWLTDIEEKRWLTSTS
jgi:hypothetical protein